jgi:hypothetical protein
MRLQLRRPAARVALAAALLLLGAPPLTPSRAGADNLIMVRGAYFREASTRVVQPVVEVWQDLPQGFDIKTHYLLDAITSASVAAGTTSDSIFTELRNEVGLAVGWTHNHLRTALGYSYSAESDYWAHALALSSQYRFWGDSATLHVNAGLGWDGSWPRTRTPNCPTANEFICRLTSYFAAVGYTQVWSPTFVTHISLEGSFLDGYQASLYRAVPNLGFENVKSERLRGVVSPRAAYYLPSSHTGFQLQYRYYRDDWGISAQMVEGRVFQRLTPDLEARFSYRYYTQTPADFWCDWMAISNCYPPNAQFYTGDPKLGPVGTSMPEIKLMWDAVSLRGVPFVGWFSEGTFDISYGRYFQNTTFGNAHLVQMGYTLPY